MKFGFEYNSIANAKTLEFQIHGIHLLNQDDV